MRPFVSQLSRYHGGAGRDYVRDGSIWSSAGVTTGIDLTLALIEEDCGRTVAMHVARVLVVYLRRMGVSRNTARCWPPKWSRRTMRSPS